MDKMEPMQALVILDQAASRALLPREDHFKIQIAVETLRAILDNRKEQSITPAAPIESKP